jgi:hypothetical protein
MPRAIAIVLAVVVSGCSSKLPVAESQEPDAAKVRFVNTVPEASIELYPESECNNGVTLIHDKVVAHIAKALADGAAKRQGMLDPRPEVNANVLDPNVAEYSFRPRQVINVGVARRCIGGLSFVAAAATQYEFVLSRPTAAAECLLSISILEAVDGKVRRRPVSTGPLVCKSIYR